MSWDSLSGIARSASFRLTFGYAIMFTCMALATLLAWGWTTIFWIEDELSEEVAQIVEQLEAVHFNHGQQALQTEVAELAARAEETGIFLNLQTAGGLKLAGDLDWDEPREGWLIMPSPYDDDEDLRVARGIRLHDGAMLLVARDAEEAYDRRELMTDGVYWVMAVTLPLATLCGWLMSAMVLRRISAITQTAQSITADAGLGRRIALQGSGDEFDELSAHLNDMLASIEDLTANIRHVSAGIAHDLRTPLTRMRNRLAEFADMPDINAEQIERIDQMSRDLTGLLATFDALLRIAQIDSGTRKAHFRVLDLTQLLRDIVETYEPVAAENQKALCLSVDGTAQIKGDPELLTQMIVNLVENAIEHTPKGTSIEINLQGVHDQYHLRVADDGPGIAEGERAKVFERFYRIGDSEDQSGSGLGLSMVRAIARLHGLRPTLYDNQPGLAVMMPFARA